MRQKPNDNSLKLPYAKKDLGQNFLINHSIVQNIVTRIDPKACGLDAILEVGPGPGALTKPLLEIGLPLFLIEHDKRMAQDWMDKLDADRVYHADAARFSVESFFSGHKLENSMLWFVSNLPYNAGIPILRNFIPHAQFKEFTIMLQREVAQKLCLDMLSVKERNKSMNSLAALTLPFFEISLVCRVSPGSFHPPPKVHSAVIHLSRKANPILPLEELNLYEQFLRILFKTPRKTLSNVLKQHLPLEKHLPALNLQSITPQMRAETLNLQQILFLFQLTK